MIYAVLASLFIAHVVYSRFLFENFRKKLYLDVMDFVIERKKNETNNFDSDVSMRRSHLRLVKTNK